VIQPDDDMMFEDVRLREPRRGTRPDLDPEFAVTACGVVDPGELAIFLDLKPAEAIERHALTDTSVELGGILLGTECIDDRTGRHFVWISESIEAKHFENTQASFTYTHDSWQAITRERDERFPDLDIVGWYHTHPDFGIFLSSHDLFIHEHFFNQPLQIAYVVDPIRQHRGFFQWNGAKIGPVSGFHLTAPRDARIALARLVNDFEGFASPEATGLSPRLEAELMAALQRPSVSHVATSSAGTAVGGIIGMALGALLVLGALWIANLNATLQEQSTMLGRLAAAQTAAADSSSTRASLAALEAKQAALDALLREVSVGSPPERIVEKYTAVALERDQLKGMLERAENDREAISRQSAENRARADALGKEIESLKQGGDAKLRDDLDAAKSDLRKIQEERAAESGILGEGGVAGLQSRYAITLWAAVGGWAIVAIGAGVMGFYWWRNQSLSEDAAIVRGK
jgi:proteasome lid subunit RPN8/RPN11